MPFFAFHRQALPTLWLKIKSPKTKRHVTFCLLSLSLVSLPQIASADIFEWEWVNPADHSQGKQQSTTFAPHGAGLVPEPFLYASYKNLTQAYLKDTNLTDAHFQNTTLTNADLSGANLTDAHFKNTTLTNADLSGANLTDAYFFQATLTDANFTNAEIRGADLGLVTDFTAAQLYSTASYQAGNLMGIIFAGIDLTGSNLGGQNLTNTHFGSATLTNADLSGANLAAAFFRFTTRLTNANLSRVDARAAESMNLLSTTTTHNFIHPDGYIRGLDIMASEVMRLWDFDPTWIPWGTNEPVGNIPILIRDSMSIDSTGTLRVVFEDDDWGSLIKFEAGVSVSLDGTLELLVEPDEETDLASLVGITFDLFDWAGVTPTGTFSQIITDEGFDWDTSNLYTTGAVTLLSAPGGLPGDFDQDSDVDGADFLAWQRGGSPNPLSTEDLASWQQAYGQADSLATSQSVPEPSTALLLAISGAFGLLTRKDRKILSRATQS